MLRAGRLLPIERNRRRHTFRAVVVEHTFHTTGMWWWKQTFPSIKVKFVDEDYAQFGEILRQETSSDAVHLSPPKQEVEIGFETGEELRNQFAVGEEVEVSFSTANGIDQFFTGAHPFRWDGVQKKQAQVAA